MTTPTTTRIPQPSNYEDIVDFHNTFGVKSAWKDIGRLDEKVMEFRVELVQEEVTRELLPAVDALRDAPSLENLAEVADALVDSVYVILGFAVALGLPWPELWNEVHRSNMAKVHPDGSIHRREDGKILKPKGWIEPDLFSILMKWQDVRAGHGHPELQRQWTLSDIKQEQEDLLKNSPNKMSDPT